MQRETKYNLIGQRFGKLVVIDRAEDIEREWNSKHISRVTWLCKCDCGRTKIAYQGSLLSGRTKTCGNSECRKGRRVIRNKYDLSGEYGIGYNASDNRKFYFDLEDYNKIKDRAWHIDDGLRKVISREGHKGKQISLARFIYGAKEGEQIIYKNGNYCDNRKENLICRQIENLVTYRLEDNYGVGVLNDNNHTTFLFDKEDYELIKNYAWYEYQGYIKTVVNGQNISLHRLVMGVVGKNGIIDHINRCRTDCRKNNLRIVDIATNNKNRARYRQDGSKVGVYKVGNNKWRVNIGLNSKSVILGIFDTYDEAVAVRIKAEQQYYENI